MSIIDDIKVSNETGEPLERLRATVIDEIIALVQLSARRKRNYLDQVKATQQVTKERDALQAQLAVATQELAGRGTTLADCIAYGLLVSDAKAAGVDVTQRTAAMWAREAIKRLTAELATAREQQTATEERVEELQEMNHQQRHVLEELRDVIDRQREELLAIKAPAPYNLIIELEQKHIPWSVKTFGSGNRTQGILKHIHKELTEIESNPHDCAEWIDVVILALDGAWRHGHSASHVVHTLFRKMHAIRQRIYPMPASEDDPSEHDRSKDDVSALKAAAQPSDKPLRIFLSREGWHSVELADAVRELCRRALDR